MKEELISYQTAKLANLKGFDPNVKLKKNTHYSDLTESLDSLGIGGAVVVHHYYAATQSLLQKWLREVHKSVITIMVYNNGEEWNETKYQVTVSEFKHFTTHDSFVKSDFSTYEEALEVGLQEALKLI